jgi:hypothetical protein
VKFEDGLSISVLRNKATSYEKLGFKTDEFKKRSNFLMATPHPHQVWYSSPTKRHFLSIVGAHMYPHWVAAPSICPYTLLWLLQRTFYHRQPPLLFAQAPPPTDDGQSHHTALSMRSVHPIIQPTIQQQCRHHKGLYKPYVSVQAPNHAQVTPELQFQTPPLFCLCPPTMNTPL